MKKKTTILLTTLSIMLLLSACGNKEPENTAKATTTATDENKADPVSTANDVAIPKVEIALGDTGYVMPIPADCYQKEITEDDRDHDIVARYMHDTSPFSFVIYRIANDGQTVMDYIQSTGDEIVKPTGITVNGTEMLHYFTMSDNKEYRIENCVFDAGHCLIRIAFVLNTDDAEDLAYQMISGIQNKAPDMNPPQAQMPEGIPENAMEMLDKAYQDVKNGNGAGPIRAGSDITISTDNETLFTTNDNLRCKDVNITQVISDDAANNGFEFTIILDNVQSSGQMFDPTFFTLKTQDGNTIQPCQVLTDIETLDDTEPDKEICMKYYIQDTQDLKEGDTVEIYYNNTYLTQKTIARQ